MESRFKIGDIVLFQPNVEKIDFKTMTTFDTSSAVRAKVVQVQFTFDKVLYDIALAVDGAFYEIFPIRSVDSVFVCPLPPAPISKEKALEQDAARIVEEIRRKKEENDKKNRDSIFDKLKRPNDTPFYHPPQTRPPNLFPHDFPPGTIICHVEGYPLMNGDIHDKQ